MARDASNPIARHWKMDAPVIDMALNRRGDTWGLALGDGNICLFEANDLVEEFQTVRAHDGVSLSLVADSDDQSFLSGGDDGALVLVERQGGEAVPVTKQPGVWIDHGAAVEGGVRAFASGKKVYLLDEAGQITGAPLEMPSSVGGLAFSPNGKRLAISHYNGVSLIWTNSKEREITALPWKGSHLGLVWAPDGKRLLSSMQEGALHGWDLSEPNDIKEMQMQGYAAKIRSMGFTTGGKFLATSGADQVICWPFTGGGPWGKQPTTLGGTDNRLVSCVAPHPRDPVIAAGYDDGMIVLAPLDGRMEIMLYPPDSSRGSTVQGLCWDGAGDSLIAGQENGNLFLYTLASIRRYATGGNR